MTDKYWVIRTTWTLRPDETLAYFTDEDNFNTDVKHSRRFVSAHGADQICRLLNRSMIFGRRECEIICSDQLLVEFVMDS